MTEKKQLRAFIDADVYERFKQLVFEKYGSLYYLGVELTNILRSYLDSHRESTHAHESEHTFGQIIRCSVDYKKESIKRGSKFVELLLWLLKNYPNEVLYSDLENYVKAHIGADKRTIKKYLHELLINCGFVKIRTRIKNSENYILQTNANKILEFLKSCNVSLHENEDSRACSCEEKFSLRAYVAERVISGDSIAEVHSQLESAGFEIKKKTVKKIAREVKAEEELL